MNMTTNLIGRLKNTNLPRTHALFPLFEAVVNSIQACEDMSSKNINEHHIIIHILREKYPIEQSRLIDDSNKKLNLDSLPEIYGFRIKDDGIGFTNSNMKSFTELDSSYKEERGCRGIGRLLWLKAFNHVDIKSDYYAENGHICRRSFSFDKDHGIIPPSPEEKDAPYAKEIQTVVTLSGFLPKYRQYAPKTISTIAANMLEHCFWYFIREGGVPQITIIDGDESIDLNSIFNNYTLGHIKCEKINIKGYDFCFTYIKARSASFSNHEICYCAADRLVKKENITNKIPGLYKKITDSNGLFTYLCFVVSPFLDERVRSERTEFNIEETKREKNDKSVSQQYYLECVIDDDIVLEDIRNKVLERVSAHLDGLLCENREKGRQRIETFIAKNAPKYRPILHHLKDLTVDPEISDKELDLTLYKSLSNLERELLAKGHDLSTRKDEEPFEDYKTRLNEYMKMASDIKRSDLANYVSHRKVILKFFENIIQKHKDGKYSKEEIIHQLIMPMRIESKEIKFDDANLWLIDERLAFHHYLASDKTLKSMPITDSSETVEPDILSFNIYENPLLVNEGQQLPLASITVIEIKRPMRNSFSGEEKDPIEQVLSYVQKIREGQVKTVHGRPIPQSKTIPAFCYIIADITPALKRRAKLYGLKPTSDYMGFFGHNPDNDYNAYIEIMSFERLISSAKERNRAFFDKLGLPCD